MNDRGISPRARRAAALTIGLLLAAQVVGLVVCLHVVCQQERRVPITFNIAALALTPLACFGLWKQSRRAVWAVLYLVAWNGTVDFWLWSVQANWLGIVALASSAVVFAAIFLLGNHPAAGMTTGVRIFCLAVASLTGYVAFWGLLFPTGTGLNWPFLAANFDGALPLKTPVPTLHARIIGAAYLAATVACVLTVFARSWREAWLGTWMILLWTGILMLITVVRLDAFTWDGNPVWFWFLAYLGFPTTAAWIVWGQPLEVVPPTQADLPRAWRLCWGVQGLILCAVAVLMLLAPGMVASVWPWPIPPLLSQIYSGPAATFGIASLMAARRGVRAEARVFSCAMIAFGLAALAASLVHRGKFNFNSPSAWVWFAALATILVVQVMILLLRLPTRASTISTPP
jgi:hypothetical protein